MSGTVRTEVDGRIFRIVVDNVAKKNAFTPDMMAELSNAFTAFDGDDALWVAVLAFAGEHTTAGLDMPKFFGPNAERRDSPPGNVDPFALKRRTLKPVVAAVQGLCLTVGIEMMLAADIVIAADTARFCQMESKRGIAPLGGAHFRFLTRTGWGNAMYHLMLCDEFDAQRALQIGLVQEVVPAGQQIARASEIAHRIARNAPVGIRAMKEAALKFIQAGEAMAIAGIPAIHAAVMGTEDAKEGIRSFVERREAQFQGR
ncbi:MAG TPA: crotonase/enoyl-CoA hydratase family protein [Reyranella sp.]|jgi:enoyl-CoA hydratase/carnithine racemase|nr:crotonase/enoyl-CoA hydratase family protein [Reyranella sp.]